jgi:hypothetical protein
MGYSGDVRLARIVANATARMVKDYLRELRRQGRIKGDLFIILEIWKETSKASLQRSLGH